MNCPHCHRPVIHPERLDGLQAIADFLGVSPAYFNQHLRKPMEVILFRRSRKVTPRLHVPMFFTYRFLVYHWLLQHPDLIALKKD